jgi:hypothetical protein
MVVNRPRDYSWRMSHLDGEGPLTTGEVEKRFRLLFGREPTEQERMDLMLPPLPTPKPGVA